MCSFTARTVMTLRLSAEERRILDNLASRRRVNRSILLRALVQREARRIGIALPKEIDKGRSGSVNV